MSFTLTKVDGGQAGWDKQINENLDGLSADVFHLSGGPVAKQNIILNSAAPKSIAHWTTANGGSLRVVTDPAYKNGLEPIFSLIHNKVSPAVDDEVYSKTDAYALEPNTDYEVHFGAMGVSQISSMDAFMLCQNASGETTNIALVTGEKLGLTGLKQYSFAFNSGDNVSVNFRIDNNGSTDGVDHQLFFTKVFVGKSEYWSPAAGDTPQIDITGWISDGITLLNGFTSYTTGAIDVPAYNIYYLDGKPWRMLIKGSVAVPKGNVATAAVCLSFPNAVTDFLFAVPEAQVHASGLVDSGAQPVTLYINKTTGTLTANSTPALAGGARIQLNSVYEK